MSKRKLSKKTAISFPAALFEEAEAVARDLGVSRSRLVQTALEEFLRKRHEAEITASFNEAIAKYDDPSDGEEELLEHGRQTVLRELADDDWGRRKNSDGHHTS